MIELASALEQGMIGRILEEYVLKEVARLWRQPTLVEHFRFNQLG
jgi:hypothetical protein